MVGRVMLYGQGIHPPVFVDLEKIRAVAFVRDPSSSLALGLGHDLAHIFHDEVTWGWWG